MKLNILKNKKRVLLVIVIIISIVGISFRNRSKTEEVKQDIKSVRVQKITLSSILTEVDYPSKLKPIREITVTPKTPGKVASINVNVGDKVLAGQILFTLDTSDLIATLQTQQAALGVAKAGLSDALLLAEQNVGKCQITYNDAENLYEKDLKLYEAGAISKQDLDKAKSSLDSYSIDLKVAQDKLNYLKQNSSTQSTQAVAAVEQAQAQVNSVQTQLNNAKISSPISGVVSAKNIEAGEIANGSAGAITVIDNSSLIAETQVPDKMLSKINVGQSVPVKINALEDKDIYGVIDNISPDTDAKNNSYIAKVKINNQNEDIKPGMFAKISLPADKKDNILVVPNEAIKIENGAKYIYIVEDNKIKKIPIETGISNDRITEIKGTVKEGAELITEGQNLLNDGEKVNVIK